MHFDVRYGKILSFLSRTLRVWARIHIPPEAVAATDRIACGYRGIFEELRREIPVVISVNAGNIYLYKESDGQ